MIPIGPVTTLNRSILKMNEECRALVATISFAVIVGMLCWRILILRQSAEILSINAGFAK
jgi:hypothetical protein